MEPYLSAANLPEPADHIIQSIFEDPVSEVVIQSCVLLRPNHESRHYEEFSWSDILVRFPAS
jgi:hypothetical protein